MGPIPFYPKSLGKFLVEENALAAQNEHTCTRFRFHHSPGVPPAFVTGSIQEHAVSVREEAVPFRDRMAIGIQHVLAASEGADKHEQSRLR